MNIELNIEPEDIKMARMTLDVNFHPNRKSIEDRFYDLCLCLLVPQEKFLRCSKVVDKLKQADFWEKGLTADAARAIVYEGGLRFGVRKWTYLYFAWNYFGSINFHITSVCLTGQEKRDWLVENVPGVGMKVATHFLRNIGATRDLAIIDLHILKYINDGASLRGKKHYLELEEKFRQKANKLGLSVVELDMIVWQKYSETPWEEYKY